MIAANVLADGFARRRNIGVLIRVDAAMTEVIKPNGHYLPSGVDGIRENFDLASERAHRQGCADNERVIFCPVGNVLLQELSAVQHLLRARRGLTVEHVARNFPSRPVSLHVRDERA
jgi:hypothetical protein